VLGATDLRALDPDPSISWSGRKLALDDAIGNADQQNCSGYALLSAVPFLSDALAPTGTVAFSTTLDLRGTGPLRINPLGHQVELSASAPWSAPGFSGLTLPSRYRVDAGGFAADWTVTSNPTTGPWMWISTNSPSCSNGAGSTVEMSRQVGVELLDAMPIYHMTERASKYALLFLALTFLTYFLFEMVVRLTIHIAQYGLLGLSITLFGLLLISFSEPLGFTPAYALSSAMVLGQASLFTWSVTRMRRPATIFAATLAGLFGFLYVVLSLELYSLLVGSVALFAVLSVVMIVTRRISWSTTQHPPTQKSLI
jgi:inner membrane protein